MICYRRPPGNVKLHRHRLSAGCAGCTIARRASEIRASQVGIISLTAGLAFVRLSKNSHFITSLSLDKKPPPGEVSWRTRCRDGGILPFNGY